MNDDERLTWLLVEVDKLTAASRKQLLAHLALSAQKLVGKADRDVDMWATAIYEGLSTALGGSDGAGQGPLVVKRVVGSPTNWAPVADFMEASGLGKATVAERQAIYRMLADLVMNRATAVAAHTRAPLSPKFVAGVAQNIRGIFDREFPGYLSAGIAGKIILQRIRANAEGEG